MIMGEGSAYSLTVNGAFPRLRDEGAAQPIPGDLPAGADYRWALIWAGALRGPRPGSPTARRS